jgi:ABC-type uncharacterized transport system auxiliary subunit
MRAFPILCVCLLSGCVSLLPPAAPRPQNVMLHPDFKFSAHLKPVEWSLTIERPLTTDLLDSRRIILNIENEKGIRTLETLADIEWNDRLPLLLQQQLISAFEQSNKITGVGQDEEDFQAHFALQINIRTAEILLTGASQQKALVELSARLISKKDRKVIAQRTFKKLSPITERTQKAFLHSYQHVFGEIISEIVIWLFKEGSDAFKKESSLNVL